MTGIDTTMNTRSEPGDPRADASASAGAAARVAGNGGTVAAPLPEMVIGVARMFAGLALARVPA